MISRRRRVLVLLVVGALSGCATFEARPARELAGRWEGRAAAAGGHVPVALVVAEDGTYRGALRVDGRDHDVHGAITELPSGQLRFDGNSGSGIVTRRERAGERVLRFQRDDGYPLFEVSARSDAPAPRKE